MSIGEDIQYFFEEDTIFSRIAIFILILIGFVVFLHIGFGIVAAVTSPATSPYLIKGMINAEHQVVIQQDPTQKGSIPIQRSQNENHGIEFTWSVWINISDLQYGYGKYKHIFHKGNDGIQYNETGLNFPNNAPGLYISPTTNSLTVIMNTYTTINEEITIPDIPIKKWVNVMIRVEGNDLDVYINGTIVKRHHLSDVVKQNYGDVFVAMNGGFNGYISSLRYFSYAAQPGEIKSIVEKGPDLSMSKSDDMNNVPPYLSLRWYFQGT